MTRPTNEMIEILSNENSHELAADLFEELTLSEQEAHEIKAGFDLTSTSQPKPCPGCTWGGPMTNHNETVVEDGMMEISSLADLPVTNDGQIKGGFTVKLPDVLVTSYQSGGHSGAGLVPHNTGALLNTSGNNTW